ncbi:aldo/keto reductase [Salinisphaera japonica]|uniref:L-fucose dehydrogenase n=1 Tax=Salinisphaera japonica YTM-1 TaxID=1209778 RepID=A0A423PVD3_9GAMM|nr:aldo/keto reductase [Salinisphaera japonica]ROO29568.1 L-fucose dehydrogenase [Salinisphaera japonica YTM-1]
MATRRQILSGAAASVAGLVSARVFAAESNSTPANNMACETPSQALPSALPDNPPLASKLFPPKYKYGVGGTQLGNIFEVTPDDQAQAMLEAAWAVGTRLFDTAPFYGFGLSERRLGHFLDDKNPEDYVLATKTGRLLKADANPPNPGIWKGDLNFSYQFDFTAAGTRRSVEDSLQRLGVGKIDLVTIHDITEPMLGKDWREQLEIAKKGAMPELTRMREEGIIGGWGMGVNNLETCLEAMDAADPDIMLQATRYNLLDHKEALAKLFPKARANDVALIIGAPLGAGYLAGTERWLYGGDVPAGFADKRARMDKLANKHGTDLRTAALQFTTAPDIVAATIPGARNAEQARANHASMTQAIPAAFWQEMKQQGLIAEDAPTPG